MLFSFLSNSKKLFTFFNAFFRPFYLLFGAQTLYAFLLTSPFLHICFSSVFLLPHIVSYCAKLILDRFIFKLPPNLHNAHLEAGEKSWHKVWKCASERKEGYLVVPSEGYECLRLRDGRGWECGRRHLSLRETLHTTPSENTAVRSMYGTTNVSQRTPNYSQRTSAAAHSRRSMAQPQHSIVPVHHPHKCSKRSLQTKKSQVGILSQQEEGGPQ